MKPWQERQIIIGLVCGHYNTHRPNTAPGTSIFDSVNTSPKTPPVENDMLMQ